jgi:hypothetical protein
MRCELSTAGRQVAYYDHDAGRRWATRLQMTLDFVLHGSTRAWLFTRDGSKVAKSSSMRSLLHRLRRRRFSRGVARRRAQGLASEQSSSAIRLFGFLPPICVRRLSYSKSRHSRCSFDPTNNRSTAQASKTEHPPGSRFGQLQRCISAAHGAAAAASRDLLQRLLITHGRHADCAFEHLTRRRKYTSLNGHVSLGLFKCHDIPHKFARIVRDGMRARLVCRAVDCQPCRARFKTVLDMRGVLRVDLSHQAIDFALQIITTVTP